MRFFMWPFLFASGLTAIILSLIGRVFAFALGIAIVAVGVALCVTIIGLIIGVPMVLFGAGLIMRSIF